MTASEQATPAIQLVAKYVLTTVAPVSAGQQAAEYGRLVQLVIDGYITVTAITSVVVPTPQ